MPENRPPVTESGAYKTWPDQSRKEEPNPPSGVLAWDKTKPRTFGRRKFVTGAAATTGAVAIGVGSKIYGDYDYEKYDKLHKELLETDQAEVADSSPSTQTPVESLPQESSPSLELENIKTAELFPDDGTKDELRDAARNAAEGLGLTVNDFFNHKRLNASYYAHQSEELLPVFLKQVLNRKDKLYEWAQKYELPVNVVATIMNIESGGINDQTSGSGAVGLFQVIPEYHMPKDMTLEEQMDPDTNAKYALEYYGGLLTDARAYLKEKHPTKEYRFGHPEIFIQAMAMYNAGATGGAKEFNELEDVQTKNYILQARGLFHTMELAQALRYDGKSNDQIVTALRSQNMDARGKVFERIRLSNDNEMNESQRVENPFNPDNPYFVGDEELFKFLGQDTFPESDDPKIQKLIKIYKDYYEGRDDQYTVPLGPSLRIWTQISPMFVLGDPINRDPEQYFGIDTKQALP